MHVHIQRLLDLQAADLRLHEIQDRLDGFPKRLAEVEGRVAEASQQVAAAKEAQTESLKDRKKFDMDVEQWKERVKKYRDQSFEVKTNEAYRALQHEIQNAEHEMAEAEDRLLERMVAGEEYDRQIKAAQANQKEVESAADTERRTIQGEYNAARKELAEAEAARARALQAVPEDLVSHYQRIAKRHHGVGLAEIHGESCGQCGVHIRPHVLQKLQRPDTEEIFHCETCTRILYYPDVPHSVPDSSSAAPSDAESSHAPARDH